MHDPIGGTHHRLMAKNLGVVRKPMAIARSASLSGGWGREGVRSEARAEQRLAPGGPQAPITRITTQPNYLWAGGFYLSTMLISTFLTVSWPALLCA